MRAQCTASQQPLDLGIPLRSPEPVFRGSLATELSFQIDCFPEDRQGHDPVGLDVISDSPAPLQGRFQGSILAAPRSQRRITGLHAVGVANTIECIPELPLGKSADGNATGGRTVVERFYRPVRLHQAEIGRGTRCNGEISGSARLSQYRCSLSLSLSLRVREGERTVSPFEWPSFPSQCSLRRSVHGTCPSRFFLLLLLLLLAPRRGSAPAPDCGTRPCPR